MRYPPNTDVPGDVVIVDSNTDGRSSDSNVISMPGADMPIHRLFVAAVALPLLAPLVAPPVHAASADPNKQAACAENPVPDLIAQYPTGGDDLTTAIAGLVAKQPCVADDVIAAADTASPEVAAALAAGLAQAAASLAMTDPAAARQIRASVYQSGNRSFAAAFSVAYRVALAASPVGLASSGPSGLPEYSTPLATSPVSPH